MSSNNTEQRSWFVLVAAGQGKRFGGALPKQYATVGGKTLLAYSLEALLDTTSIAGGVMVVAEEDPVWSRLDLPMDKVRVTVGGDVRARSVFNGLRVLMEQASEQDWVMVHDAARPCINNQWLNGLLQQLEGHPIGGVPVVPVVDTLKYGSQDYVEKTVDRNHMWRAQTPQIFRLGLLYRALELALSAGKPVTDESSAVELAGSKPLLLSGLESNIKVTRQEDLALAKYYLSQGS
ncbi:MAG: 2-C-methyl-D-erythritol 4-phosphate cytidylyltransferase [Pseudomonadales bacterium]